MIGIQTQFDEILAPIKIGNVTIPNRIVMPAMVTNFSDGDGRVTEGMVKYYEERARYGVGLIIIESCSITPEEKNAQRQASIFNDRFIIGLTRLVKNLHQYGVKVGIQLAHPGRYAVSGQLLSASDVPSFRTKAIPKAMSLENIKRIIGAFAEGVLRAKLAGFDLVEFHFAHGYLVPQFWSPLTNKRTDQYGGSFENRMRISQEIIENTRKLTQGDVPIICRISGREYIQGGMKIGETKLIAKYLEKCGIDGIHVSGGIVDSGFFTVPRMAIPKGVFVQDAAEIKKTVRIPVIVAGKITDLILGAKIVKSGKADLVSMGRALIADPELIKKTLEQRYDDIRPCIGCCYCHERIKNGEPLGCAINAEVGREKEYNKGFRIKTKTVLVVGGGPAGLEVARVASLNGNRVILYEKEDELGGELRFAWIPPYKGILRKYLRFLIHQARNSNVEINLKKKLTYREIKIRQPDEIILAMGRGSFKNFFPKGSGPNVLKATEALNKPDRVGKKVVLVGGGMIGCETAEYLSNPGFEVSFKGLNSGGSLLVRKRNRKGTGDARKVSIISASSGIAQDCEFFSRMLLIERLKEKNVGVFTRAKVEKLTQHGLLFRNDIGEKKFIPCDTVVIARRPIPQCYLKRKLGKEGFEVHSIGDCVRMEGIANAIHTGFHIGQLI